MPMLFPTSPTVGQVFTSGGRSWVWTGATWDSPTATNTLLAPYGLELISSQNVSGVTAINFNNVFSNSYENYRIVINGSSSTRTEITGRLRAGGVNATGASYVTSALYVDPLGFVSFYAASNTHASMGFSEATNSISTIDIASPFQARFTAFSANGSGIGTNGVLWQAATGHRLSTSYDGIAILTAHNFTGSVTVYGYKV